MGISVVVLSSCATWLTAPGDESGKRKIVTFQDISFEIPARGWQEIGNKAQRAQFLHKYGGVRSVDIAVWPVRVPPGLRSLSPRQHATKYFDAERTLLRYQGRWEGFLESDREIGGRRYPVMTFKIPGAVTAPVVTDGLFLLYFPNDLAVRQGFYVLMWSDTHPVNEPGRGLADLDAIVSSLRCCR